MATSGAQGLAAIVVMALGRSVTTVGWRRTCSGIAGFSGFPAPTCTVAASVGPVDFLALLSLVSSSPPSIHLRITSTPSLAMGGLFGGITGSSLWALRVKRRLESGLPAVATAPPEPPVMVAL